MNGCDIKAGERKRKHGELIKEIKGFGKNGKNMKDELKTTEINNIQGKYQQRMEYEMFL